MPVLALLVLVLLQVPWCKVDWGDAPIWVGAFVTFCAFVAAGWVVRIERGRDAKRDAADQDAREAAERAQQADRVAAWHEGWRRQTVLLNGSFLPVYDVQVALIGPDGLRFPYPQRQAVVRPGETVMPWPHSLREAQNKDHYPALELAEVLASIEFRDTANRVWIRDEHGVLRRVSTRAYGVVNLSGSGEFSVAAMSETSDDD